MSLETIFAQASVKTLGKTEIEIKQVSLEDIPFVVGLASKVINEDKSPIREKIILLIKDDFKSVISVFVRLTNLTPDQVTKLNLAATIQIFTLIIEENKDFLLVHLPEQMAKLKAVMGGKNKSKS